MKLTKLHKQLVAITKKYPIKKAAIKWNRLVAKELLRLYKPLGQGVFRYVVKAHSDSGKPVALKFVIDRAEFGLSRHTFFHSNKIEWDLYNYIAKKYKHISKFILKPIAFFKINGHEFLIMPIINKENPLVKSWNKKVVRAMAKNLSDVEGHNWGMHNGMPKIFDTNIWKKEELNKEIDDVFKALLKIRH